jgi:D-sedoheptulose 7-phosphate isomerase
VQKIESYFTTLNQTLRDAEVSQSDGRPVSFSEAVDLMAADMRQAHSSGRKVMFIGNGGSAGICSHMATDYSKNGKIRALAFNDSSALTCLGNDLGYDRVFAEQIEFHGNSGDILVAISSSGRSPNILSAVEAAKKKGCKVFTLSGFDPDNPLRKAGDVNIYLRNQEYGFVEVGHLAILHAVLDLHMGWHP